MGLCIAAKGDRQCPLWVKSRHRSTSNQCPLYPQKRTFDDRCRAYSQGIFDLFCTTCLETRQRTTCTDYSQGESFAQWTPIGFSCVRMHSAETSRLHTKDAKGVGSRSSRNVLNFSTRPRCAAKKKGLDIPQSRPKLVALSSRRRLPDAPR
jgi:hypothetical protein